MDSEVPFTNLLRCNHHWPFCPALTLTRLTLTNLTLIPIIMRILTILFPVTQGAELRRSSGRRTAAVIRTPDCGGRAACGLPDLVGPITTGDSSAGKCKFLLGCAFRAGLPG